MMEGEDGEIALSTSVAFKKKRSTVSASSQEEKRSSRKVFLFFRYTFK